MSFYAIVCPLAGWSRPSGLRKEPANISALAAEVVFVRTHNYLEWLKCCIHYTHVVVSDPSHPATCHAQDGAIMRIEIGDLGYRNSGTA